MPSPANPKTDDATMTNRFLSAASSAGAAVNRDPDPSQTDDSTGDGDDDADDPLLSASAPAGDGRGSAPAGSGLIQVPHPKTGKVRAMTQDELVAAYNQAIERGNDANRLRQEVSSLRKQVTLSTQMEADLETIRTRGPDMEGALRRLPSYKSLGISPAEVEEVIRLHRESAASTGEAGATAGPLTMDAMPPEMQQDYQERQAEKLAERRRATVAQMNEALDNDPVVGSILHSEDTPDARTARIRKYAESVLQEKAAEAVKARRPLNLGPQLYAEIAQEVRAWMADVGILDDDGRPTGGGAFATARSTGVPARKAGPSTPSLGGAPYGGSTAYQAKNTPPKRPSAKDDKNYARWLLDRMKYESGR